MPKAFPKILLFQLRNHIPIENLIAEILHLPNKNSENHFRFLCPICSDFNTATNPATNLARCFRCQKNFNPIDIVMTVNHFNFVDTVTFLKNILPQFQKN